MSIAQGGKYRWLERAPPLIHVALHKYDFCFRVSGYEFFGEEGAGRVADCLLTRCQVTIPASDRLGSKWKRTAHPTVSEQLIELRTTEFAFSVPLRVEGCLPHDAVGRVFEPRPMVVAFVVAELLQSYAHCYATVSGCFGGSRHGTALHVWSYTRTRMDRVHARAIDLVYPATVQRAKGNTGGLHRVPVLENPNESTSMGTLRLLPRRSSHVRCGFMLSAMVLIGGMRSLRLVGVLEPCFICKCSTDRSLSTMLLSCIAPAP